MRAGACGRTGERIMIRVTIESVGANPRTLHTLEITNDGPTTAWLSDADGHSDYVVRAGDVAFRLLAHRESLGVLELVDRAVTSLRSLGVR